MLVLALLGALCLSMVRLAPTSAAPTNFCRKVVHVSVPAYHTVKVSVSKFYPDCDDPQPYAGEFVNLKIGGHAEDPSGYPAEPDGVTDQNGEARITYHFRSGEVVNARVCALQPPPHIPVAAR